MTDAVDMATGEPPAPVPVEVTPAPPAAEPEMVKEKEKKPTPAANNDKNEDAAPQEQTGPFAFGEKVLAPQGGQFYDAKILACERKKKGQWEYYVHYQGWNKKWDEWVVASDLLKANADAATKKRKMESNEAAMKAEGKKGRSEGKAGGAGKEGGKKGGEKKKIIADVDVEDKGLGKCMGGEGEGVDLVKIPLTTELKKLLIADWEYITKENKLLPLPRTPCVKDLLDEYLASKSAGPGAEGGVAAAGGGGGDQAEAAADGGPAGGAAGGGGAGDAAALSGDLGDGNLRDVVAGIRAYFDKALGSMLLYRYERGQCRDLLQDDKPACESYGAEHLLRLFVKLPELLPYTNMEEQSLASLTAKLEDVLRFLHAHRARLFSDAMQKT